MNTTKSEPSWIIAILWIAVIYFYFLIFAQFAFLELLKVKYPNETSIKLIMGVMGASGILGSLVTPYVLERFKVSKLMQLSAFCCALASLSSLLNGALFLFISIALVMGIALGVLTVSLAGHVSRIFGVLNVAIGVGIGTGVAYAFCNLPIIFRASATYQAIIASIVMLIASQLPFRLSVEKNLSPSCSKMPKKWLLSGLLILLILVWLDSAAFFIIQQNSELKDTTWGFGLLGRNALVHLCAAVLSGYFLSRGYFQLVTTLALTILGISALMLDFPELRLQAGMLYPAGVSLYSVALIIFPAWHLGGSTKQGIKRASIVFAIAGWFGSAMGIGMVQNLTRIPIAFVIFSFLAVLAPCLIRLLKKREFIVASLISWVCYFSGEIVISKIGEQNSGIAHQEEIIEEGKKVYLKEGCIHCHTRYIRPNTKDEEVWGSYISKDILRSETPPLIGYRRQGPDLLHVGLRRSSEWLKQHFIDPKAFNKESVMPSYAHLFENNSVEGDALIAFLRASEKEVLNEYLQKIGQWRPEGSSGDVGNGKNKFQQHCAMCHGWKSSDSGPLAHHFQRPPTNLQDGPFTFSADLTNSDDSRQRIAGIIKFGIYGTDMPGHETLSDKVILDIVSYLYKLRAKELK